MRTRLSDGNASGDRRSQTPPTIGYALGWNNRSKPGDIRRWRGLINLERYHCCAKQHCRHRHPIGGEACNIQAHHEILGATEGDFPKRLAEQFITLPAVKFVQEILEITRRRLLVFFQPQQPANFVVVELVHLPLSLRHRVLAKLVQIILQLPIRVEEPGTYRSFRNVQDFTDLGVGHSLNMEHSHNGSVFIRQFHHGLVQSSLEFGQVGLPYRSSGLSLLEKLLFVLNASVYVVKIEVNTTYAII